MPIFWWIEAWTELMGSMKQVTVADPVVNSLVDALLFLPSVRHVYQVSLFVYFGLLIPLEASIVLESINSK